MDDSGGKTVGLRVIFCQKSAEIQKKMQVEEFRDRNLLPC